MTLNELITRLKNIGFKPAKGPGTYKHTTRLDHSSVAAGSVFVGDGPGVSYPRHAAQTLLRGTGAFLIANGRSRGMTKELTALGVSPTGTIPDPAKRPSPDDPYWRDAPALPRLVTAMERHFKP